MRMYPFLARPNTNVVREGDLKQLFLNPSGQTEEFL